MRRQSNLKTMPKTTGRYRTYYQGAAEVAEPVSIVTEPTGYGGKETGVITPFLQSVITGIFAAGAFWTLGWVALYYWAFSIPWFPIGLTIGVCVGGLRWVSLLDIYLNGLYRIEEFLGHDIDNDSHIGKPSVAAPLRIAVDLRKDQNSSATMRSHLKITDEQVFRWGRKILRSNSLPISEGKRVMGVSQKTYTDFVKLMVKSGILEPVGEWENAKRVLTEAGRRAIADCLRENTSAPLLGGSV